MRDADTVRFRCDLCEKTWPHGYGSITVLRTMVAAHLWVEHGIKGADSEDMLPMTDEQVAWVRAQRNDGEDRG